MPKPTRDFRTTIDYQEAQTATVACYFGSLKFDPLKDYRKDVISKGRNSPYFGRVFCPEARKNTPEPYPGQWTYEKNQAFWAGLIDSNRPLILLTDITFYKFIRGTVDELMWLQDNGYTFLPDTRNPTNTWAIPPETPNPNPAIGDYENGNGPDGNSQQMLDRLAGIRRNILQQQAAYRNDPNVLNISADTLLRLGQRTQEKEALESALAGFQMALNLAPNNITIACNIGLAHSKLNQNAEQKNAYLKTFKLLMEKEDAVYDDFSKIAKALYDTKCYDEAFMCYERAHQLDLSNPNHLNNAGLALTRQDKFEEALKYYNEALKLNPDSLIALLNRGSTLTQLNRLEESLADYKKVYSLKPDEKTKKAIADLELKLKPNISEESESSLKFT
jgi:tetratricopeptide (TPR) repeat protein